MTNKPLIDNGMKRMLLAAFAAFICLVSCEKDPMNAISGTWEASTIKMNIEGMEMSFDISKFEVGIDMTFRKNGTGSITETSDDYSETLSFDYDYDGSILSITIDGETAGIPAEVSGDNLTMTIDGSMIDEEEFDGRVELNFKKK